MTWPKTETSRSQGRKHPKALGAISAMLACWIGLTPAFAQSPTTLPDLMRSLSEVKSVEANYREVVESALLRQPMSSTGTLSYRAPDELIKAADHGDRLQIEGDSITLVNGDDRRQFSLSDSEALKGIILAMRATFAGDLSVLQALYKLDFESGDEGWTLDLSPKERRLLSVFERILIRGRGNRIDRMDVIEGNGDSRSLQLSNLKLNTTPR